MSYAFLSEVGFELADALLFTFAFTGVELGASICEYFTWASVFGYGLL
jgi:hypothetical protein